MTRYEEVKSRSMNVGLGVHQGSVLAPLIFVIYVYVCINDVIRDTVCVCGTIHRLSKF